jgi:hypothetical protein
MNILRNYMRQQNLEEGLEGDTDKLGRCFGREKQDGK